MKDELKQFPYGVNVRDLEPICMGDIEDLEKEKREVAEFECSTTEGFIRREDLIRLATSAEGIEICHGVCLSREVSGEHCRCIRERFYQVSIYELYKKSREFFQQNLALGIMGALVGDKK